MRRYRKTIRVKDYDYSETGGYFVTICTYKHLFRFGEISNQEIVLNDMGEMAEQCWLSLEDRFSGVELDYYVVMPNHIHGVITVSARKNDVGAIHELPLHRNRIERRRMLIPKIIGYFKMNSAKYINRLHHSTGNPVWQRNYYERILRNESELYRIREYIQNNPTKWDLDRENPLSNNFKLEHNQYWKGIYDLCRSNS